MFNLPEDFDLENDEPTRIKIIGVGLIGNSYLNKIKSLKLNGIDFLAVMSEKNFDDVENFLKDVDILFVASKAGDNLAKKIAEYMKKLDMPIVISVVDSQYDADFVKNFDAIIVAKPADVANQIAWFANIVRSEGLVPISFVDFQTMFAGLDKKNMFVAIGEGSDSNSAVKKVILSEEYEDQIAKATGITFLISGASDRISMIEIGEVSTEIGDAAPNAEIVWGAQVDNSLGDNIVITIIVIGF